MPEKEKTETVEKAGEKTKVTKHLTPEEKIFQLFMMIAFPLLIGFVTWGVILLAYYQWLIY